MSFVWRTLTPSERKRWGRASISQIQISAMVHQRLHYMNKRSSHCAGHVTFRRRLVMIIVDRKYVVLCMRFSKTMFLFTCIAEAPEEPNPYVKSSIREWKRCTRLLSLSCGVAIIYMIVTYLLSVCFTERRCPFNGKQFLLWRKCKNAWIQELKEGGLLPSMSLPKVEALACNPVEK